MTDAIATALDRRRLSRRVTLWRALAFLAIAAALIAALWAFGAFRGLAAGPYIARVPITGVITQDRDLMNLLDRLRRDPNVAGVVLAVDSPGGTAVGGEAIYGAVRELAVAKPTVASVGGLAASAGYMIAAGADHIVARNASIVGSIGVIVQLPQVGGLLDKVGVDVFTVKSGSVKGEPSTFAKEADPEAVAMMQRMVDSSFQWFVDLVAERRPLNRTETLRLADGSVFSGRQALPLRLVDEIGGEDEAVAWLVRERGVAPNLSLRERKPAEDGLSGLLGFGSRDSGMAVADAVRQEIRRLAPGVFLDGLVSIWQG